MKKSVFLLCVILSLFAGTSFAQDWIQTNGPGGSDIKTILFNSKKDMFALSDALIRSTDHGGSWKQIPVVQYAGIGSIAIAPNQDIYAGTNIGIYKSTDDGDSWAKVSASNIDQLLASPDNTIYGLSRYQETPYFLRSIDAGSTWDSLPIHTISTFESIDIDSNGTLIISGEANTYRSTDKAETWQQITSGLDFSIYRGITCGKGGNIFIQNEAYGYSVRSSDDGQTWQPLPFKRGAFASNRSGRILFVGDSALKYSDDNGVTWKDFGGFGQWGIGKSLTTILCADADSGFFIQLNGALFHAASNGINPWQLIAIPLSTIGSILTLPNGNIVAATNPQSGNALASISTDSGKNWKPIIDTAFTYFATNWLVIDSSKNILAGYYLNLYHSSDYGKSWDILPCPVGAKYVTSGVVHPDGDIFIGTDVGLFRSSNSGISWNSIDSVPKDQVYSISLNSSGDLFAGVDGTFRSLDKGVTWQKFPDLIVHLVCDSYGDLYASDDYVRDVRRSFDNGETWLPFTDGLSDYYISGMMEAPDGTIFACTDNGVFMHGLGDCAWTPYIDGLTSTDVLSMASDKDGRLYAGSYACGIFKSTHTFNTASRYASIRSGDVNLGTALIGETVCKDVVIKNVGLAPFTLTKAFTVLDPVPFSVDPQSVAKLPLVVNSKDSVTLSVCFHPYQPGNYASEVDWATDISDTSCTPRKYQSFISGVALFKDGVGDVSQNLQFSLNPNPSKGNLVIVTIGAIGVTDKSVRPTELSMFDVLGKEVYHQDLAPDISQIEIPIGGLSEGIYYIKLSSASGSVSQKFVKEK